MSTRGACSVVRTMPTGLPDCTSSVSSGAIVRQRVDDRVERPPVPGGPPGAAVDDQVVGALGDVRVEVVLQHPQRGLGTPASRRPSRTAGRADGSRSLHEPDRIPPGGRCGARRAGPYGGPPHCADDRPVAARRDEAPFSPERWPPDAGRLHVRTPCSAGAADRAGHPARGPTGGGTGVPGRRGADPARRPELVGGRRRRPARRRGLHRPRQRAARPAGAAVRLDDRPARPGPRVPDGLVRAGRGRGWSGSRRRCRPGCSRRPGSPARRTRRARRGGRR